MKFELILLAILILTINSATNDDCTGVKADSEGNLDRESCTDITLDSGKACCRLKQEKIDSETRSCVVVDKDDTDTATKYGEDLVKKDSSLLQVEITCKSTSDVTVDGELGKESKTYNTKCEAVEKPSADSCAAVTDSTANGKGFYCCFQQRNYTDTTKDNDEAECDFITKLEYDQLEAIISSNLKEAEEEGNAFTNYIFDCGSGKNSVKGSGTKITEKNIDGKTSGVSLLKTGVIISIFALLI